MSGFIQWVTHGLKQDGLQVDRRWLSRLQAIAVVVALIAASYLVVVSQTAAQGRHIQKLRDQWFRLKRENAHRQVQIARKSATPVLVRRAEELGLSPVDQIEHYHLVDGR